MPSIDSRSTATVARTGRAHRALRIALAGLVIAVVAGVGYGVMSRSAEEEAARRVQQAQRPPVRNHVTALGRLAPRGEVIHVSAPDGDRLDRLAVEEGQHVQAGTVLAHLESHAERRADRERIARQLKEAESRLSAETVYGHAVIAEAHARLRQIEIVSGLEIQAQEARVRQLEAEVVNARRELTRVASLRQREVVAQQDYDRQALTVERNELDLQAARVVLEKLRQANDLDVRTARAQVETSQAGLTRAQAAIELESLREALRLAEARVERTVIRAPVTGQIFKIWRRPGEETGKRPILEMGDVAQMFAVAEVYETDLRRVRVGQAATVSSPALPQPLHGTVYLVGRSIMKNGVVDTDPAAAVDRRIAEVKVRLHDSETAAQMVNLQVTVDIEVGGS